MNRYAFHGTERATIELDGTFDAGRLTLPAGLALDTTDGRGRVRLFAFHVDDLRIARVPLLRASYGEVLWRIAVRDADTPAWWVCACDLGHLGARLAAARFVRYPVRDLAVTVDATRIAVRGDLGVLSLALGPAGSEEVPAEPRPLLVGAGAEYEVPWGDDATPTHPATVRVEADSLAMATVGAAVTWAPIARVRAGRTHRCGVARRRDRVSIPARE